MHEWLESDLWAVAVAPSGARVDDGVEIEHRKSLAHLKTCKGVGFRIFDCERGRRWECRVEAETGRLQGGRGGRERVRGTKGIAQKRRLKGLKENIPCFIIKEEIERA